MIWERLWHQINLKSHVKVSRRLVLRCSQKAKLFDIHEADVYELVWTDRVPDIVSSATTILDETPLHELSENIDLSKLDETRLSSCTTADTQPERDTTCSF